MNGYAFAYFFTEGRGTEQALDLYRRNFRPSATLTKPQATICVWALAADTEPEAKRLLMTREHWRVGFEKCLREPLISPEEATALPLHRSRARHHRGAAQEGDGRDGGASGRALQRSGCTPATG